MSETHYCLGGDGDNPRSVDPELRAKSEEKIRDIERLNTVEIDELNYKFEIARRTELVDGLNDKAIEATDILSGMLDDMDSRKLREEELKKMCNDVNYHAQLDSARAVDEAWIAGHHSEVDHLDRCVIEEKLRIGELKDKLADIQEEINALKNKLQIVDEK